MLARTTILRIHWEGRDITREVSPYITAFTFTDNSAGKADDITLTLEDRKGLWLTDWFPSKSDRINASIITLHNSLPCGEFSIDQIDYSAPPKIISIKAVSTSAKKKAKGEKHSKAWENITLREIAADIAASNSLSLFYDAGTYSLERREQVQQSDLEFLEGLCSDFGLNVKITASKLIIYSEGNYDSHESTGTLSAQDKGLISYKFSAKTAGTYRKARVKYHHPVKNEDYDAEETDEDEEGSERELVIHERVDSQAQAQEIATQRLKSANSKEISGTITLKGDTRFVAGSNITLEGFGGFSGKYFIETATHSLGLGYTTSLKLKMGSASKKALKNAKAKARKKTKATGAGELYYEGTRYYGAE